MIKIMLAEDHQIVRNGIKSLLEKERNFQMVGEASNGIDAIKLLEEGIETDVILADVNMPKMDGLELVRNVKARFPHIKTLILSMLDHEKYVANVLNVGAMGYLLKNVDHKEMVFAIDHVNQGKPYICSELSIKIFKKLAKQITQQQDGDDDVADFTQRELEVLSLIAEGLTNQEIADKLFTSKRTVEGHRQNMIDKTGVKNTAALVQYAFRAGLIS